MNMRTCLFIVALLVAAISSGHRADAEVPRASDDPLRHGHALLIGISHYKDPRWPQLDDIPLQLTQLEKGLKDHFDTVEVVQDLEAVPLLNKIFDFMRTYGNDSGARLFIYYAGHGYTEIQRNQTVGYITGIDTPPIDGTIQAYNAARPKAISMVELHAPLERPAKSVLFVFVSCFAGTIFTNRAGNDSPRPLTTDIVAQLMERPARDFITAGRANQRVPAHSPIPDLFLAALNGAADIYKHGVISSNEIHDYLLDRVQQIRNINLTPQVGKLQDPAFAEGAFLFRVPNPTMRAPDREGPIRLYRENADKGDAFAQLNLAWLYDRGIGGLPKDDREAARLYKLAADQGNAVAQNNLGLFYQEGRGDLPQDDIKAARLYRLAAEQDNAEAQYNLANFFLAGRGGLQKDDCQAKHFFTLAAHQGYRDAISRLDHLLCRPRSP
jgi:hypothetical protein